MLEEKKTITCHTTHGLRVYDLIKSYCMYHVVEIHVPPQDVQANLLPLAAHQEDITECGFPFRSTLGDEEVEKNVV